MKKIVITVVGKDTVGIIAKTTAYLAKNIVGGYFNMMMVVDASGCPKTLEKIGLELTRLGQTIGLTIRCQRAEIFEKMHRI